MLASSRQWMVLVLVLLCLTSVCVLYSAVRLYPRGTQEFVEGINEMVRDEAGGSRPLHGSREDKLISQWIVVRSEGNDCDVTDLCQIPGWGVVVVGDQDTSPQWSRRGCFYIGNRSAPNEDIQHSGLHSAGTTSRKNLGYLHAIRHGAAVLLDTDRCSNCRSAACVAGFQLSPGSWSGLLYAGHSWMFQPYQHWGQSSLTPRGWPGSLEDKTPGRIHHHHYRLDREWPIPAIQQGVSSGCVDVEGAPPGDGMRLDPAAPPVLLPPSVYSPISSRHTLFMHSSLWALYLPCSGPAHLRDIWRGYWAQRLLWEIGGRVGSVQVEPVQHQDHNNTTVYNASQQEDTKRLIGTLSQWVCPVDISFFACVNTLTSFMATERFWTHKDVNGVRLWLEDLSALGYPEPNRYKSMHMFGGIDINLSNELQQFVTKHKTSAYETLDLTHWWYLAVHQGSFVHFVPVNQTQIIGIKGSKQSNVCSTVSVTTTKRAHNQIQNVKYDKSFFHDILLIVIFNRFKWFAKSLDYVETMHRKFFPNIVYCSDTCHYECYQKLEPQLKHNVSFIQAPISGGFYGYACFTLAASMNHNVAGYLVVGDDDLVNTWTLQALDKTKPWINKDMGNFSCTEGAGDQWWNPNKHKFSSAIDQIRKLSEKTKHNDVPKFENFFERYRNNSGAMDRCMKSIVDVYYVPRSVSRDIIPVFDIFLSHKVFLEFAIPTSYLGVFDMDQVQWIKGNNLWGGDREHIWDFYNSTKHHYLHPVKFSNAKNVDFFCEQHYVNLLYFYL